VYNSGSGANALQFTQGEAVIDSTADVGGTLATTVTGAAQLTTARLNQTALSLSGAGTKVTILPNGALANVLESLVMDATSTLDLSNNDLILRATSANKDAIHADAQAKIQSAQNGLDPNLVTNWNGPGITSSSARASNVATGFDLVGLGVIRNSDLDIITGLPGSGYTSFGGVPVTPDDVLIKHTYVGDANLSGAVTFDDYVGMDNAFFGLIPNLGWATGDINFDNTINFDDYSKVDQAFFFQAAPLAARQAPHAVLSTVQAAPAMALDKTQSSSTIGLPDELIALPPALRVVDLQGQTTPTDAVMRSAADPILQSADSLADARLGISGRSGSRDLWDVALLRVIDE
jgi:hypothetical protein